MFRLVPGLLLLVLPTLSATAQAPEIEWQRCLGTPVGEHGTRPIAVVQTADDGFIVLSEISGNGGDITGWHEGYSTTGLPTSDLWVVKLSSGGTVLWQRVCGGSDAESGLGIVVSADGGYIVGGYTHSMDGDVTGHHGDRDLWVFKLTSEGQMVWQRALGGTSLEFYTALLEPFPWSTYMAATSNGGCVVATTTYSQDGDVVGNHGLSDMWVVALDAGGEIEWQRCLGGSDVEEVFALKVDDGGAIHVAGVTTSNDGDVTANHGTADLFVAKLSPTGEVLWANNFGGSEDDNAYDLELTADGGCITTGYTYSSDGDVSGHHGSTDVWVVKLDAAGELQWQRALGGSSDDWFPKVEQAVGGGYYVAAMTVNTDGDVSGWHESIGSTQPDIWVVRLNADGDLLWQRCLGGTDQDDLRTLIALPTGGCAILGTGFSTDGDVQGNHGPWDGWMLELSASGELEWQECLGSSGYDLPVGLIRTTDGGYVHFSSVVRNDGDVDPAQFHGVADTWVVKFLSNDHTGVRDAIMRAFGLAPIPATHTVQITLDPSFASGRFTFHDATGRTIHTGMMSYGSHTLDVQAWPRGLYSVTLQHGSGSSALRLILE